MEYEQPIKRSKKPLIIAVAVVVILAVVAIAIVMAIGSKIETSESSADKAVTAQEQSVATNEEVQQNLKDLDATIKQANSDQTNAKASLKDGTNQIKVGN